MLTLHSPAFLEGGIIPTRHTGRGEDLSPPFTAKGIPEGSVCLLYTSRPGPVPGGDYQHLRLY